VDATLTIELEDPPSREVSLEPDVTRMRRASVPAEYLEPLTSRLSMGGPVVRRISSGSTDDVELERFLAEEAADSDFYLLRLTCTLRGDADEPFTEVLLGVALSAADAAFEAPIAWSMEPSRLAEAVEISKSIRFGPSLKILGVGLESQLEMSEKRQRDEVFVEALYELESTPTWAMYPTGSTALRGLHRFNLVVKAPRGSTTLGEVAATARIERKRFGVIAYQAVWGGAPAPITFALPGDGEPADGG
jgi:hypothetical protein